MASKENSMVHENVENLRPAYGKVKSYYGKAKVVDYSNEDIYRITLRSYETNVLSRTYEEDNSIKWRGYKSWENASNTTRRHIIEFMMQHFSWHYCYYDSLGLCYDVDDDVYRKKLLPQAVNFITACTTAGQPATHEQLWNYIYYIYTQTDYAIGGKAWITWVDGLLDTMRAGVPVDDVLA